MRRFRARFVSYVPVIADIEFRAASLDDAQAKADALARAANADGGMTDDLTAACIPQWHEMDDVEILSIEEDLQARPLHS